MRKPLPSRTAVLELLASQDRALDAREVAQRLDVAPASETGLLRMLDDLVFDGVVTARGDKFRIGAADKVPEKRVTTTEKHDRPDKHVKHVTAMPASTSASSASSKKHLKGLPKHAGRDGYREQRQQREVNRDNDREMPKFKVAAEPRAATVHRTTEPVKRGAPKQNGGRERREGFLKVNPRGFGFVASPTASGDDVYVSPENLNGAMHGDTVVVDIVARGSRGPEGHIAEGKGLLPERDTRDVNVGIDPVLGSEQTYHLEGVELRQCLAAGVSVGPSECLQH